MKKFLIYGLLCPLAAGVASCTEDRFGESDTKSDKDQTQFIAVQISSPVNGTGTRAFEDGTKNESFVNRLDFLFYDVAGNPTSAPQTITEFNGDGFVDDNTNSNVTRVYKTVVPVNLVQGQNLPSQVICIVNGESGAVNELKSKRLGDLIDVERSYFRNGSNFLMSNSVYYGQNILTGQADQRLCATPINANTQLFSNEEDAKKAVSGSDAGALVDIYVERVAAKVGLTMGSTAVTAYTLVNGEGGGNVSLTFVPEYWAMNATANTNYLTKRYGVDNNGEITLLPSYSQITTALGGAGWTTWNDQTNHRSYWGCSPSYFDNKYPDVSDDVNDLEENSNEEEYPVSYLSYNNVVTQANRTDDGGIGKQAIAAVGGGFAITNFGDKATGFIYTRETTVASATIRNIAGANPAAAVASAVLVGKYTVTGATTGTNGTFYVDRNSGTIDGKTVGRFYGTENAAKTVLSNRQSIVFTSSNGTGRPAASVFALAHPVKAVRDAAGTKIAGRLVALQIVNLPASPIYFYNLNASGEGQYEQVTTENLTAVNAQLLQAGYLEMFNNGHAFFSIPIRHLNWNNNLYADGAYKWAEMPVGALGVVRNHVYNLNINSVKGLGNGVRSDDQPMVPAKEEANQFIAAKINILAWNVANTWSTDL